MNFICPKKNIGNQIDEKSALHIAYGVDANFGFPLGVSISSVVLNNQNLPIVFHIFTDGLFSDDMRRLTALGQKFKNIALYIYKINLKNINFLPTGFIWTRAAYYRIFVATNLASITDRFIYLDADIICLKSLLPLWVRDFENKIAIVVADDTSMVKYAQKQFSFNSDKYFNSGMLLINVENWNRENISNQFLHTFQEKNNFKYFDQDCLNILLQNKLLFVENIYNYIYHLSSNCQDIPKDTVLLHYSSTVKPWQSWGQFHFLSRLWLKYRDYSPWYDVPIVQPTTYKQAKFMARTMKKLHNYPQYIKWILRYAYWKMSDKLLRRE